MTLEFHLGLSSLQGGDFKDGDFTGWIQRDSEVGGGAADYNSLLIAVGANINGAMSEPLQVSLADFYNISGWNQVDSLDVGNYQFKLVYFSDVAGSNSISGDSIATYNSRTVWEKTEKTLSGSGSGADLIFPSTTQSVRVEQIWYNVGDNPQGKARMDDVIFGNLVQMYPEYDYKGGEIQLRNQMRTPSGKGYLYKHGDYEKFQFTVNYLPGSSAAIVNSWWDANAKLLFLITSDDITEVHSVILMNKDTPFQQFNKPYADKLKGKVLLEGY